MQVERIYDYISYPHVSAGGAGWGSLYSYTTYAVLDNSTSCAWLTCYCAMLLMASGRLLRAPGFRCVAWRRRVQGFECRAFTNCFVLGFVSRVSFTGFTGSMGPGRISAKRSTSAFNTPLEGAEFACCFSRCLKANLGLSLVSLLPLVGLIMFVVSVESRLRLEEAAAQDSRSVA